MVAMASSVKESFKRFGIEQRDVLLDQRVFRLGKNANEVGLGERAKLHANRKAALQLGNQVGRLRGVERARGNKQNVVGAHHAVARVNGGAFDDRQNVALHAFARDVGAMAVSRPAILSISSMNKMPICSTRSTAMRVT